MHRKGDTSTTMQVIFALFLTMLVIGVMMSRLDFSMEGKMQPEILALTTSSYIDALSSMEAGRISIKFDKPWDITLKDGSLKFSSGEKDGESGVMGNVKETIISDAREIEITKKSGMPAEMAKAGE